jgi:hypothetical protein
MPDPPTRPVQPVDDSYAVIDAEIARLPGVYRDAILLCDVQGVPRPEAAQRLGVPDGTLSSRLANGRKKLAARLAGRGLAPPAAGAFLVAVPDALANRTVDTAVAALAGTAVPYSVLELTRTGESVMRYALGAAVLTVVGLAAGAAAWPQEKTQDLPKNPEVAVKGEEPKPAAGKNSIRPKRLKTIELNYEATRTHWSSDGRFLVVEGSNQFDIFDTQANFLKVGHETQLSVVGFAHGSHAMLTVTPPSSRINAVHQYVAFSLHTQSTPGGGQSIEFDRQSNPTDLDAHPGFWVRIIPNGNQVLSISASSMVGDEARSDEKGQKHVYNVHVSESRNITNVVRSFEVQGDDYRFRGAALSPDGKLLVVPTIALPKVVVTAYDVSTGEKKWTSEISSEGIPADVSNYPMDFTPDGTKVLVAAPYYVETETPNPGTGVIGNRGGGRGAILSKVVALDTSTGKPIQVPFLNRPLAGVVFGGFSSTGAMFAVATGESSPQSNPTVQIFDTKSGAVLKSWPGHAVPSFAPNRPLLALLEPFDVLEQKDGRINDVRHTSLGFWDCSAPAK